MRDGRSGSAEQAHAFFDVIAEMRPFRSFGDAGLYLLSGLFAAAFAIVVVARGRSLASSYVAVCCSLLLLGVLRRRFTTYSAYAEAAMVLIAITVISREYGRRSPALVALARIALLLGLDPGPLIVHGATAGPAAAAAPGWPLRPERRGINAGAVRRAGHSR